MATDTDTLTRPTGTLTRAPLIGLTLGAWAHVARSGGLAPDTLTVRLTADPDSSPDTAAAFAADRTGRRLGWLHADADTLHAIQRLGWIDATVTALRPVHPAETPPLEVAYIDPRGETDIDPLLAQIEHADPDADGWLPETDPLLMQMALGGETAEPWTPTQPDRLLAQMALADPDADGWTPVTDPLLMQMALADPDAEPWTPTLPADAADGIDDLWVVIDVSDRGWTIRRAADTPDAHLADAAGLMPAARSKLGARSRAARRTARRRVLR